MQMACEYNPQSYLYGDSRFDPYVFTAYQPAELIHRLEPSNITEDTCGAVIVTGNRAFFPTMIRRESKRTSRLRTATVVH